MIRIPDNLLVCIPKNASITIRSAFNELAMFLKESANIICEKTICVPSSAFCISIGSTVAIENAGISQPDDWKEDSFGSVIKDNILFIYGKTDRAVLYGVYEFLEDVVGVRFLSPKENYIPKHSEGIYLPEDYCKNETPVFDIRSYWTKDGEESASYSARHRVMTIWYDPVSAEYYGGGYRERYVNDGHNLNKLYQEGYVAIHGEPEDGALIYEGGLDIKSGEKLKLYYTKTENPSYKGMLCLSDKSIRPYIVRGLQERVKARPNCNHFGVMQEDTKFFCACKGCTETENKTDLIIDLSNEVAQKINEWSQGEGKVFTGGKEIFIVAIAYEYTERACSIAVDEHVIINLSLMNCANYSYAFTDENQFDSCKKALSEWTKILKPDNLVFYHYDTNFNNQHWYIANLYHMLPNLQFMQNYSKFIVTFEAGESFAECWQALLKTYVVSKLMWEPDRYTQDDVTNMAKEFCQLYYGEYGDVVWNYIETMESAYQDICRTYHKDHQYPYYVAVADHILLTNNQSEAIEDAYGMKHFTNANDPKYFTKEFLMEQISKLRKAYTSAQGQMQKKLANVLLTAEIMYFVNWKYYNHIDEAISYTEIAGDWIRYTEFVAMCHDIQKLVSQIDDEWQRVRQSLNLILGADNYAGMDGSRPFDFWSV